jgi:hypothetical protein
LTLRRRPANQSEEEDDAMRKRIATSALLLSLLTFGLAVAEERNTYKAMWLSIAHPGLGEYYLKGWGSFENCPQKKFWLGLIPIYGWPGYLQVKSAIDARHGAPTTISELRSVTATVPLRHTMRRWTSFRWSGKQAP